MAQFLKLPEIVGSNANQGKPQVINADKIIAACLVGASQIQLITTNTFLDQAEENSIGIEITPNTAENRNACLAGINKALTSNPGGRVVMLSPDSAYNITNIEVKSGQ